MLLTHKESIPMLLISITSDTIYSFYIFPAARPFHFLIQKRKLVPVGILLCSRQNLIHSSSTMPDYCGEDLVLPARPYLVAPSLHLLFFSLVLFVVLAWFVGR